MALDRHFFDSIRCDVTQRGSYSASQVRALLDTVESQVNALTQENRQLREKLEGMQSSQAEISDTLSAARLLSGKLLEKARMDADDILAAANAERDAIMSTVQQQMVSNVQSCIDSLRRQQQDNIEMINAAWQGFLCSLDGDIPSSSDTASTTARTPTPSGGDSPDISELQRRVGAIADELRQIGE